jgi:dipeptidyl aminopeptidase/acylaminoacyl peptidase
MAEPAPTQTAIAGRIPVEWCLDGRDLTEPRLSPDGGVVAMVVRWQRSAGIVLVPVGGGAERLLTTSPPPAPGRGLGGGCFAWLPDSRGVVYVAVDGELWCQPLAAPPRQLTAFERGCRAPSVAPDGSYVVVMVDEAEVWRVKLEADQPNDPIRLDDGGDAFCFDPDVSGDSTRAVWMAWSPPSMPWDSAQAVTATVGTPAAAVERWGSADASAQQPRWCSDGSLACVHDASGWLNVHIDGAPIAAEAAEHAGPTWGMGQRSYAVSPDSRFVALTRNEGGFGRLCVAVRASGEVRDVARGVHGQLSWCGNVLVALRAGARTPTQVVAYDTTTWERTVLAVGPVAGWDHVELPEPELVTAATPSESSDVTDTPPVIELHARRFVAGSGRLLCWVHGGPTDQWQVDFRPRIAYWWSRGWDVLVVDPRGTTGHGRNHQRALNGGWGRHDVDDTAALIRHAHDEGWATADHTVVIGASSGGLTALGVLADHPDLIAGGIVSSPVSDLADLAATTHRFEAHYTDTLVGAPDDPDTARRMIELSPLHHADRIAGPLLLFHGSDDPVVACTQSDLLVERIRAVGGNVDYIVYEGEGHGFRDPLNQRDEYARIERFLDGIAGTTSSG